MLVQQVFDRDQAHGHYHYINIKLHPQNHTKRRLLCKIFKRMKC